MLEETGVSPPLGSMMSKRTPPNPARTLVESYVMKPWRVTWVAPLLSFCVLWPAATVALGAMKVSAGGTRKLPLLTVTGTETIAPLTRAATSLFVMVRTLGDAVSTLKSTEKTCAVETVTEDPPSRTCADSKAPTPFEQEPVTTNGLMPANTSGAELKLDPTALRTVGS